MEIQGLPTLNHVLQHTLRSLCTDSQWVYAVFWRILPRNYPPPQWETDGGLMDRTKGNKRNWILVWEDGFCNFSACSVAAKETRMGSHLFGSRKHRGTEDSEAMNPELFFKMSHEVYNYGEGLMGKVAADNSHKWVYREPLEHEISFLSPWHGSLDPHPRTWEAQFKSGIQTIAVVAVQEGVLQLGSVKKIIEDLNFVILTQRKFNYLQSIPGVFVSHPTSHTAKKRTQNGEGSPPPERGQWMSQEERLTPSGLTSRYVDPFLSPRSGTDWWRPSTSSTTDTTVLGVKRPPDRDTLFSLNLKDYAYISSGNSHGYDNPSPKKALNTGQTSPQGGTSPCLSNLLPSMSSLQALLSKLPSVTPGTERDNGLTSPAQQATSPPRSPQTNGSGARPPLSRSASRGRASCLDLSPTADASSLSDTVDTPSKALLQPSQRTDVSNRDGASMASGSDGSTPSDVVSDVVSSDQIEQQAAEDLHRAVNMYQHINRSKDMAELEDKLSSSFLDTFDPLSDFGFHEALGSSDTYNSFLNEIY